MRDKIQEIVVQAVAGTKDLTEAIDQLLVLYNVSKRHLIEEMLEDMKGVHSEYHKECVEDYLDDGC
jgi:hypothetical protein